MIRLEERDFEDPQRVARLASASNLDVPAFIKRFGYLVGIEK
jgi:hypothetical protein